MRLKATMKQMEEVTQTPGGNDINKHDRFEFIRLEFTFIADTAGQKRPVDLDEHFFWGDLPPLPFELHSMPVPGFHHFCFSKIAVK